MDASTPPPPPTSVAKFSYAADSDSVDEIRNVLNSELKSLHNWLITNRQSLSIAKTCTEFMTVAFREKIRTIDDEVTIQINECEINRFGSMHIDKI